MAMDGAGGDPLDLDSVQALVEAASPCVYCPESEVVVTHVL